MIKPVLGIIGCGNIGGRHARNFLANGYDVVVYDIDRNALEALQKRGAKIATDSAHLASQCDVVLTALPTPSDVVYVVLGESEEEKKEDGPVGDNVASDRSVIRGIRPGSTFIDVTTNSPDIVLYLHDVLANIGVEMIDAPFNDSPAGAVSTSGVGLSIMASGQRQTFERLLPVLNIMADRVLYCGPIGSGTRCKLIHNVVNATAVQAVCEGITLGLACGLDLGIIWDAVRFGSFGQNAGDIHGLPHYWFSRRCDDPSRKPAFTVRLLHKDVRIALQMADAHGVSVPHLALTKRDFQQAEERGWSEYATTKVNCLQEERAGVKAVGSFPKEKPAAAAPKEKQIQISLGAAALLVVATNLVQYAMKRKAA